MWDEAVQLDLCSSVSTGLMAVIHGSRIVGSFQAAPPWPGRANNLNGLLYVNSRGYCLVCSHNSDILLLQSALELMDLQS